MKAYSVTVDIVVRAENSVQAEVDVRERLADLVGRGDIYGALVAGVEETDSDDMAALNDSR